MGRQKRSRRSARRNPPASRYIGYALVGAAIYLLFRKSKGVGENGSSPKPFTASDAYYQEASVRDLIRLKSNFPTGSQPELEAKTRAAMIKQVFYENAMKDAMKSAGPNRASLESAYSIKETDPGWMMDMKLRNVRAIAGLPPMNIQSELAMFEQKMGQSIAKSPLIPTTPILAVPEASQIAQVQKDRSAREVAVAQEMQRLYGPRSAAASSAGPVIVKDISQIDVRTGSVIPSDYEAASAAMDRGPAPVVQRTLPIGPGGQVPKLISASAARAVGGTVPITGKLLKAEAPDAAQADPLTASRQRLDELNKGAVKSAERDITGLYEKALKNKGITDNFMRAMKERTGEFHAIKFEQGQGSFNQNTSTEAISTAFYAGVDTKRGGHELRAYQDDFVKQTKLTKEMGQKPTSENIQKMVDNLKSMPQSSLTSKQKEFMKVSQRLGEKNAQAQKAFSQVVETKQLEAKHANEVQDLRNLARERGYVTSEGDLDMSNPAFKNAMSELKSQQSIEKQRLKEQQTGVSTTTQAQREEWQKPTQAATEASEKRYVAQELVKQAMQEGKYQPASGESFEDAVKKEMATGNIGKDAAMRAEAEKRLADMRSKAAAAQQAARLTPLPPKVVAQLPQVPPSQIPAPTLPSLIPGGRPGIIVIKKRPGGGAKPPESGGGTDYSYEEE